MTVYISVYGAKVVPRRQSLIIVPADAARARSSLRRSAWRINLIARKSIYAKLNGRRFVRERRSCRVQAGAIGIRRAFEGAQ